MITTTGKLEFNNENDKEEIDKLCQKFNYCKRYSYKRLLENPYIYSGNIRKDNENYLSYRFNLNAMQVRDAIEESEMLISSCRELGTKPEKVIFGSRKLFEKLKKRHLSKQQLEVIKCKYRETRNFSFYARGDIRTKGNQLLRIVENPVEISGNLLRINIGWRKYIYAKIITHHKKWNQLLQAKKYCVRLTRKDNTYYASFSFDEQFKDVPQIIGFQNGAIGIDLNASPSNLAWCEIKEDGNYVQSGTIGTPELYDCSTNKRDYYCWQYAYQVVELAQRLNKGIVIEDLKGIQGTNRVTSNFCFAKWKQCLTLAAQRSGVRCLIVDPAYTSMIGCIKYSPIYNLSRHESAAMVIARRGYFETKNGKEFIEKIPKCYINEIKLNKSFVSEINCEGNVTQGKKEVDTDLTFKTIYEIYKVVVLTGQSTAKKKQNIPKSKRKAKKRVVLPNWSILKRVLLEDQSIYDFFSICKVDNQETK